MDLVSRMEVIRIRLLDHQRSLAAPYGWLIFIFSFNTEFSLKHIKVGKGFRENSSQKFT